MSLAELYNWQERISAFAFDDCDLKRHITKSLVQTYFLFRLGLRLLEGLVDHFVPVQLSLQPFMRLAFPSPSLFVSESEPHAERGPIVG